MEYFTRGEEDTPGAPAMVFVEATVTIDTIGCGLRCRVRCYLAALQWVLG